MANTGLRDRGRNNRELAGSNSHRWQQVVASRASRAAVNARKAAVDGAGVVVAAVAAVRRNINTE
jgi:hypothetical protein